MDDVTLVLCSKCEGMGYRSWDECVDHHRRDYETRSEECRFCEGSGRRWQTVSTRYTAFRNTK